MLDDCERRVAASAMHLDHTLRLWSITLGAIAVGQIIPDLRNLRCRHGTDGRARFALVRHHGWHADDNTTTELLMQTVIDDHVYPMHAALRRTAGLAHGLMLGNSASMLVSATRALSGGPSHAFVRRITARLLDTPLLRDAARHTVDEDGGLIVDSVTRRSCCLCYRLPAAHVCADCPLQDAAVTRTVRGRSDTC
ncbi:(2Fe-2S)-binding protein [Micromonospora sp. SL1-18]|uniref:(2Fe-2S)-binding protein n=1 Tax=Micromonospora sp. SL1-18 TaxID=3399128 RepID=UPI003A4DDFD5